jgi:hypothetical protein
MRVLYRTYLNVVGIGSNLAGVLRRQCGGSPRIKCLTKFISTFFNGEREMGSGMVTGTDIENGIYFNFKKEAWATPTSSGS